MTCRLRVRAQLRQSSHIYGPLSEVLKAQPHGCWYRWLQSLHMCHGEQDVVGEKVVSPWKSIKCYYYYYITILMHTCNTWVCLNGIIVDGSYCNCVYCSSYTLQVIERLIIALEELVTTNSIDDLLWHECNQFEMCTSLL